MRLLIISNNAGGLIGFRKKLLQTLLLQGVELYVSVPRDDFSDRIKELGCHIIDTPMDRRGMNPLKDIKLLFTYVKMIKSISPDVVLTYTIKPNIYGALACRKTKTPYMVNITGLGTSIENPGMLRKLVLFLYRTALKKAECVFFQNKSNMDFMTENNIGPAAKILLPGSGVDLAEHTYRDYPPETAPISFVAIMRIMKDKGIEEYLACAQRMKKEYPNIKFTLVGRYDEENWKERIEHDVNEGIIDYLGHRNDIDDILAQHHCLINPSYHEGMSNVLLEAAACGRPVIASNVPGCQETFDEGVSGFGFEVKNSESLIHAVKKFISIPHCQKIQMGQAGRHKMEMQFDRHTVVAEYINQIQHIKNKKRT